MRKGGTGLSEYLRIRSQRGIMAGRKSAFSRALTGRENRSIFRAFMALGMCQSYRFRAPMNIGAGPILS